MTGGSLKIPDDPEPFQITVDGHLIASISQHGGGQWFLLDAQGYPIAQRRSWSAIINDAKNLIGD